MTIGKRTAQGKYFDGGADIRWKYMVESRKWAMATERVKLWSIARFIVSLQNSCIMHL
tara:strand:+ start:840 stop:1013 length:174 start_codon:yes stop_codon:yes gene_type:complete